MALSSGREEFAVAFVGKDELTGMVKDLEAKLKGLEGQVKKTGVSGVGSFKSLGDSLKESTAGFTSLKSGFASIKENVIGLPIIFGGIATAAFGVLTALKDAFGNDLAAQFTANFKRDIEALRASADRLVAALSAGKRGAALGTDDLETHGKIAELEQQALNAVQQRRREYEAMPGFAKATLDLVGGQRLQEGEIHGLEVKLNELTKLRYEVEFAARGINAEALTNRIAQAEAARRLNEQLELQVKNSWALLGPLKAAGGVLGVVGALGVGGTVNDAVTKELFKPRSFGGGGGGSAKKGVSNADWEKLQKEWKDEAIDEVERNIQRIAQQEERAAEEAQKAAEAEAKYQEVLGEWAKEDHARGIREQVDSVAALTGALTGLVDISQETRDAFAEIADVFTKTGEAGGTMGDAFAASVGPMGKLAASFLKNERDKALLRGLVETGESIAAFASGNIPGGVGHAAAAAAFFVAAGKGAGGAGGQRGIGAQGGTGPRAGAAGSAGGDSGPRTVVYNISAGVMDGQSVQRTIQRAENSARGTGWEARRGW